MGTTMDWYHKGHDRIVELAWQRFQRPKPPKPKGSDCIQVKCQWIHWDKFILSFHFCKILCTFILKYWNKNNKLKYLPLAWTYWERLGERGEDDVELGLLGDQVCLFHRSTGSIYTQSFMLIILHDIHSSITNNAPVHPISLWLNC
jgi:hypothetical protein